MKIKCRNINPETGEVCGALNPRSRKHCWKCGRELSSSNRPRIWLVLLITTLFVGGTIYLAIDSNKVEIIAKSSDPAKGTVTGGGNYVRFDTVTLIAQANKGCRFVEWNDGNTDSIRKVVADQGLIFVARFDSIVSITPIEAVQETPIIPKFLITVESADTNKGMVKGGGTYDSLTPATIEAIANNGYLFVSWDDGNKQEKRTFRVTTNQKYVAKFVEKPTETIPPVGQRIKGKKEYWFGRYEGDLKNGIPEGRGMMYYNCHVQIAKHDRESHYAEKGDYFDGVWSNGDIEVGDLYNGKGELKYHICPGGRTKQYELNDDK